MSANSKAQKKNNAKTVQFTDEEVLRGWGPKHPCCGGCGKTDKKRYSGSNCSTCYTQARDARLGIGKNGPEATAKRKARLEAKVLETELLLKALKNELKTL